MSGFDPLGDLPVPPPPSTDANELTAEASAVVAGAVRAIVEHDVEALARMNELDPDPYDWTHD